MQPIRLDVNNVREDVIFGTGSMSGSHTKSSPPAERELREVDSSSRVLADTQDAQGAKAAGKPRTSLLRWARDAAIGLAMLVAVPIAVVQVKGTAIDFQYELAKDRLAETDRWRQFMAPKDPSVSPKQGGVAFRQLQLVGGTDQFPLRPLAPSTAPKSRSRKFPEGMFANMRLPRFSGPAAEVLLGTRPQDFTSAELTYLRGIAESPIWRDFDMVGAADQVDMLGGSYVLPFRGDAFFTPSWRFNDAKDLANDAAARATYYLVTGQPDRAEAALRSIVSFGFALVDNGTTAIEALLGRAIVRTGIDDLELLRMVLHSEGPEIAARSRPPAVGERHMRERTAAGIRALEARAVVQLQDPAMPRSLRFEVLRQLSWSTCATAKGMLLGPNDDVRDAFAQAKSSLARFPSERAYLDVLIAGPGNLNESLGREALSNRLVLGAASVAGAILNNPRISGCTRIVLANQ